MGIVRINGSNVSGSISDKYGDNYTIVPFTNITVLNGSITIVINANAGYIIKTASDMDKYGYETPITVPANATTLTLNRTAGSTDVKINLTTEILAVPDGTLKVSGLNATAVASNAVGVITELPIGVNVTLPYGVYTVTLTALEGNKFTMVQTIDKYGENYPVEFEPDAEIVSLPVTVSNNKMDIEFTTDSNLPVPTFTAYNHLYYMTTEKMVEFTNDRFTIMQGDPTNETDISGNIINILELPFKIDPEFIRTEKPIVLGVTTLNTQGFQLKDDNYIIDFGEIVIPNKYNNSYDLLNTEINLHLPFMENVTIPVDYAVGQTIRIVYDIDLYTGDTTVILYSTKLNDKVFMNQSGKIGRDIPFMRKTGQQIGSLGSITGINNGVYSPFIEVIRNKPYNYENQFNTPIPVTTTLSTATGFVRVDNIKLETDATTEEKNKIIQILSEGVFING